MGGGGGAWEEVLGRRGWGEGRGRSRGGGGRHWVAQIGTVSTMGERREEYRGASERGTNGEGDGSGWRRGGPNLAEWMWRVEWRSGEEGVVVGSGRWREGEDPGGSHGWRTGSWRWMEEET